MTEAEKAVIEAQREDLNRLKMEQDKLKAVVREFFAVLDQLPDNRMFESGLEAAILEFARQVGPLIKEA